MSAPPEKGPYRMRAIVPPEPVITPVVADPLGAFRSRHPHTVRSAVAIAVAGAAVLVFLALAFPGASAFCAATAMFGAFVLAVVVIARRAVRVDRHTDGLVVWRGPEREPVAFSDVDEVWLCLDQVGPLGLRISRLRAARLHLHDGTDRLVPLDVVDGITVARALLRRCTDPLATDAQRALAAGERIAFGEVTIDRRGISIDGERSAWSDIRLVRFQPGRVAFVRKQTLVAWKTVSLEDVPHPTLFAKLVMLRAKNVEPDRGWAALAE